MPLTREQAADIADAVEASMKHQDWPEGYYWIELIETDDGWLPVARLAPHDE